MFALRAPELNSWFVIPVHVFFSLGIVLDQSNSLFCECSNSHCIVAASIPSSLLLPYLPLPLLVFGVFLKYRKPLGELLIAENEIYQHSRGQKEDH